MEKIKIVRVIARLIIGGPTIHVILLNAGLTNDRYESLLVCGAENPGEASMLDLAHQRGLKTTLIPEIVGEATFGLRDVVAIAKLYRIIRQVKPHILHTHTAKAGFVGRLAARLAGVPIVIHTYHGHVLRGYYSPFKTFFLKWMERGLALVTDRIVAVSQTIRQDIAAYGVAPLDKIEVIPLGLELDDFLGNNDLPRGKFRQEFGIPSDAPVVGIVGRIVPIKNHWLFLKAAQRIATLMHSAHFVVVGDGLLRPELESYARQLGIDSQVVFTGWRRDLAQVYRDLDVLVISSINEGTPVSAIEAMASGCPVVATRVGGVPDILIDRETGYLVSSDNAEEMTDAVVRLLQDSELARRIGEASRAFVAQSFTAQRLVADTERLYSHLLQKKGLVSVE